MYFRLVLGLILALNPACLLFTVAWTPPDHVKANSDDPSRPCKPYDADGCSIPFGLPFFYKGQFTPSCDRHDVCYACGVDYNISRFLCDKGFRRDTLSTCGSEYLTRTAPTALPTHVFQVNKTDDSETASHQQRFREIVEEHGIASLETILEREVSALSKVYPELRLQQFQAWFSSHELQVRLFAEWVELLAKYIQQHASEQFLPLQNVQVGRNGIVDNDWCVEVDKYLEAHDKATPSSSGMGCLDIGYLVCNFFSEVYYVAVRLFGHFGYWQEADYYCHERWVSKCLPQPPSTVLKFIPHNSSIHGVM